MKRKYGGRLIAIFCALIVMFIVILSEFFIPAVGELFKGSLLFLLPFAIFSLLGAILIFFTVKEKVKGLLKTFLILTGASSACFLLFIILHNFVYGLFIYLFGEGFWNGGDEPVFFILAIFVCPIGFLVGAIGSIVLFIKKK